MRCDVFLTLALKARDAARMGCPERYLQALIELKAQIDTELGMLAQQRPQDAPGEEDRSWDTHPIDYRSRSM